MPYQGVLSSARYSEGWRFWYPLPQTDFLLATKKGELNFVNEVQPELENLMSEIEALSKASKLPEKVNRNYWDSWLLDKYNDYLF